MRHGILASIVAGVGGAQLAPDKFMLASLLQLKADDEPAEQDELIAFLKKKLPPAPSPTTLQVKTGPEGGINFEQPVPGSKSTG